MIKKVALILSLVIITSSVSVIITMFLVDSSDTPSTYKTHKIDSKILSEQRELIVKLPVAYEENTSKTYPVIYVFGGNTLTYNIAYDTELLCRTGHIEEIIVVGIPNISQDTRQRDLTPPFMRQDIDELDSPLGQADKYLEFISNEVIKVVEGTYRTNSERIAVGHSREGLMVMYSLIANPNLFKGRLALSPALWRENNIFVKHLESYLNKADSLNSYLFMSMGSKEVEKMTKAFDLTIALLKKESNSKKVQWDSYYTHGAVHNNNALLSAPIGLEKVLKNMQD